ncbi:MAG: class I SAM-dependent methyltransferase [Chlamydiales bacterium]|nr:class I SAM-dependent methyltransferase [Chlamydiales bacterium]
MQREVNALYNIWLKGTNPKKKISQEDSWFEAIRKLCLQYKRPINVLDIGAHFGYFSFRLADIFPGTFVLLEDDDKVLSSLYSFCHYNAYKNCILLTQKISVEALSKLSQVEHFDIVLLLDKRFYYDDITPFLSLGSHFFYGTSSSELKYIHCQEKHLSMPFWKKTEDHVSVKSSFENKVVQFNQYSLNWPSGITLSTFFEFEGMYPSKSTLESLYNTKSHPWNTFLTEGKLVSIKSTHTQENDFQLLPSLLFKQNKTQEDIFYQDLWLKGRCIYKGQRDCQERYQHIANLCSQFKRPIKVLDIGANCGYFSFRLAEQFSGTFIMVEAGRWALKQLIPLYDKNNLPNTVLLTKNLNLEDLLLLADTEHFDIVLAMSVMHHFSENYADVFKCLTQLGTYLFFEHPNNKEHCLNIERVINEPINLSTHLHKLCCQTLTLNFHSDIKRDMYLITCNKEKLERPFWRETEGPLLLKSTFDRCEGVYQNSNRLIALPTNIHSQTYDKFK